MAASAYSYVPYCGAPPTPADLAARWNIDPVLLCVLGGVLLAYVAHSEPGLWGKRPLARWRRASFYAGWSVTTLALLSPLCALSVALFSARVGQHMVLALIAAPLLALSTPARAVTKGSVMAAVAAFAAVLWMWHAPAAYDMTFRSDLAYWAMHLSILGVAWWLWSALFAAAPRNPGIALAAGLAAGVQMGLLGCVLTFSTRPIYAPHLMTTASFGLSPLADQQLGGALMWAPAGAILAALLIGALAAALRRAELAHPSAA